MHRNTERPRNAVGEGILLLNTDGVLLRGAGLCGRRYSRCTHCHEPHSGTVNKQTNNATPAFFRFAITHLVGSRLHQRDIPLNVIADYLFRSEPGTRICYHFSRAAATFPEESAITYPLFLSPAVTSLMHSGNPLRLPVVPDTYLSLIHI